tara:strand:- start:683 stop:796 length:114 start_codon:yes stop_codon:yes gene_type:complete
LLLAAVVVVGREWAEVEVLVVLFIIQLTLLFPVLFMT